MKKQQLSEMKVMELRELAVKEGLKYYNTNEKRKMNKLEIIEMLNNHFSSKSEKNKIEFSNMTPVEFVKYFKSISKNATSKSELQKIKVLYDQSLLKIKPKLTDKYNKLLVRQWSITVNQVKSLLIQTTNRIGGI